jgi:hypothetical protein
LTFPAHAVTVIIMQKTGAGLHTAASTFWDTKRDGEFAAEEGWSWRRVLFHLGPLPLCICSDMCKVAWENSTMNAICTIYGLALAPAPAEDG